jgi:hypothetical protein
MPSSDQLRRDVLVHAVGVLGTCNSMIDFGAGIDTAAALRHARSLIQAGLDSDVAQGASGSAGHAERLRILAEIDEALAGAHAASGLDPLTWVERRVQARLAPLMFGS